MHFPRSCDDVVHCVVARTISRLSCGIVERTPPIFGTPYFGSSNAGLGRDGECKRCCHQIRGRVEEWLSVIFRRHARSVDWNCTDVPTGRSRERTYNFTLCAFRDECVQASVNGNLHVHEQRWRGETQICREREQGSTRQCRPSIHLV